MENKLQQEVDKALANAFLVDQKLLNEAKKQKGKSVLEGKKGVPDDEIVVERPKQFNCEVFVEDPEEYRSLLQISMKTLLKEELGYTDRDFDKREVEKVIEDWVEKIWFMNSNTQEPIRD